MRAFRDLKVWRKAHGLTVAVDKATSTFPKEEQYDLTSQIRRSSASIPASIAEGCGRSGGPGLARFLHMGLSELEYHLLLAHDLALLKGPGYDRLASEVIEVKRMLAAFIGKLTADS